MIDRRRFLEVVGALGISPAFAAHATDRKLGFAAYPFTLGVASGYPAPNGFVLWTRLAPKPFEPGGGLAPGPVPIRWEVAEDERFGRVVASGTEYPTQEWAHSVHAEVTGLAPERWYFYRFLARDAVSPVGRTRTAPAAGASNPRLRFAFASCQQYEQGWFTAYRHMVAEDLDLVAFLGDYVYESSWGREHVRKHEAGEPYTLEQYRARYALYKADADLQRAHQMVPWICTWDDHEVDNDYAADRPEDGMPRERFLQRRAAAYRAYYEHMPLPSSMRPSGPDMRIHTELRWGRLANFFVLDDRQYRAYQVCPSRAGGSTVVDPEVCREIDEPSRSMLGAAQEAWLARGLVQSEARWNVLAQQTLMAQLDRQFGARRQFWTDGWDGYPAARRRLLEHIGTHKVRNAVVIGGDYHMHWVADLRPDFDDPRSPVVASEFCGTSISSQAASQKMVDALVATNPHMKFGRSDRRGYARIDIAGDRCQVDLVGLETVKKPESRAEVLARFVVEDGRPGPQRV